ncbi:MAG: hypothetical protein HQL46_05525 [Gammaproteobacteria bacterium]|nr:hypothetical protein [Gammaproteobacteria bacterium]
MKTYIQFSIIILTVLSLFACSPQYKIVNEYIAPEANSGKLCVKQCYIENKSCNKKCDQKHNLCLAEKEKLARENFDQKLHEYHYSLEDYELDIGHYYAEKRLYELQLDSLETKKQNALLKCKLKHIDKKDCYAYKNLKHDSKMMTEPFKPHKPHKPSLVNEITLYQDLCVKDCFCSNVFSKCYIACGGKIISNKVCISNCK